VRRNSKKRGEIFFGNRISYIQKLYQGLADIVK
jgi:hypothetical protein